MRVVITETLQKTVEAESVEEVKEQYAKCKIILLPEDLVSVEIEGE